MKAASLFGLRAGTGILLILWGLMKIEAPDHAIRISEKYYGGAVSMDMLQLPFGVLQLLVGALVVLGLFRTYILPVQALILTVGALAIWKYLLDPFGLYFLTEETANLLFFPSLTVVAATFAQIAFRDDDAWALDNRIS